MKRGRTADITDQCFDISTVGHLLYKLDEDYAEFQEKPTSSRCALNSAMTGCHVKDWLWAQVYKADQAKQQEHFGKIFKRSDDFEADLLKRCPDLEIVQVICSGAKHYGNNSANRIPHFSIGGMIISLTKTGPGVHRMFPADFGLWVKGRDGKTKLFLEVIGEVTSYWRTFVEPEQYYQPFLLWGPRHHRSRCSAFGNEPRLAPNANSERWLESGPSRFFVRAPIKAPKATQERWKASFKVLTDPASFNLYPGN